MPALVLDSAALSVLAHGDDPARRDRVRAAMAEAAAAGFVVRVPTVVRAELCRSTALRAQVEQVMAGLGLQTANLGAVAAKHVGRMLGRDGLDSCALADAAVIATAIRHGGASWRPAIRMTWERSPLTTTTSWFWRSEAS